MHVEIGPGRECGLCAFQGLLDQACEHVPVSSLDPSSQEVTQILPTYINGLTIPPRCDCSYSEISVRNYILLLHCTSHAAEHHKLPCFTLLTPTLVDICYLCYSFCLNKTRTFFGLFQQIHTF